MHFKTMNMHLSTFIWIFQVTVSVLLAVSRGTAGDSVVCGGNLTQDNGEITSPRHPRPYPANVDCTWLIQVPEMYMIELTFSAFSLELSYNCSCDYLLVEETEGNRIGKFCGFEKPNAIFSKKPALILRFQSDRSISLNGFQARYRFRLDTNCTVNRSRNNSDIFSPLYPQQYPNNFHCTWRIKVPDGYIIRLTFCNIDIEYEHNCGFDYVKVEEMEGDIIGKFCGNVRPPVITSVSNTVIMMFHTDGNKNGYGFKARYEFLPKPNENSTFSAEANRTTEYGTYTDTSYGTDGTTEITPHETATPNGSEASHTTDETQTLRVIEVPHESQTGGMLETQTLHGPGVSYEAGTILETQTLHGPNVSQESGTIIETQTLHGPGVPEESSTILETQTLHGPGVSQESGTILETQTLHGPGVFHETSIQYETVTPDLSPSSHATDHVYLVNEFLSKMEKCANGKDKTVEITLGILLGLSILINAVVFYIYKRRRNRNAMFLKHSAFPQHNENPSNYDSRSTKESVTFLL